MNRPEEHLIRPAASASSVAIQRGASPDEPVPAPEDRENPFQIAPAQPPELSFDHTVTWGTQWGAFIFWLLGMAISVYMLIVEPNRTWVDWFLRPLCFPLVLFNIGGILGALAGFMKWLSFRFSK